MPVPFDDATTLLTTGANGVRTYYAEEFPKEYSRFGKSITKLFTPKFEQIDGDGVTVQCKSHNMYGARTSRNLNADFPTPRAFGIDSFRIRLLETDSALNDFRRLAVSLQTTDLDLQRRANKKAAAVDWVASLVSEARDNIAESLALHHNLDDTARVALINGTPAKNDNREFASCSAIGATGGARVPIDNGSIAALPRGLLLSRYTGDTLDGKLWVTDYNPADRSVGFYGVNANDEPDSTVSIADLADNDALYISGEKDNGLRSYAYWWTDPTSGESFFTRDRTDPTYRFLLPHVSGPTTVQPFTKAYLDAAMLDLGYIDEDPDGAYIMHSTLDLEQKYRNELGDDVMRTLPADQKGKTVLEYGFDGAQYRHPTCGRIVFSPDALAKPNEIKLARLGDWVAYHPGMKTFRWMPGQVSNWYRMPSSVPGAGDTTTFRMDGYMAMCAACLDPRRQVKIRNVSA